MSYAVPGGYNTFALSLEATGGMTAAFARNVKSFRLNQYHEMRPVTKRAGYFNRFAPDQAARVLYTDGTDALWVDRADRPNVNNDFQFEAENYRTSRYNWGDILGRLAIEQAEWLLQELVNSGLGQKAMTYRTLLLLGVLSGATWGSNTSDVDGGLLTGGQNWGNGTASGANANNFFNSLMAGASQIALATGGVVQPEHLVLVMGPASAIALRNSAEFSAAFIQSPLALDAIRGEDNINYQWGIPSQVHGIRVVVENAVYNSAAQGQAASMGYALPKGTAYLLCRPKDKFVRARPDDLPYQDEEAPPVLSTAVCFAKEDFTVEMFDESKHRRIECDVVSDIQYALSSPLSGYKFTKCFG